MYCWEILQSFRSVDLIAHVSDSGNKQLGAGGIRDMTRPDGTSQGFGVQLEHCMKRPLPESAALGRIRATVTTTVTTTDIEIWSKED